ncbi:MAG: DUF1294 domain-containing protein [Lachnospiraceae bacterium]|nr:DUF1294 domain-containing protein [Lachnospiraceae bacterium]
MKTYFIVINIITFLLFGADKLKAIRGRWRIKEATLLIFCMAFGSIGGLAGMHIFHHKTKKPLFCIGVPAIIIIQAVILRIIAKNM